MKRVLFYDRSGTRNQPGFRGRTSAFWMREASGTDDDFGEFAIPEELYWALFNLGIVEFFRTLPTKNGIEAYEEGFLLSEGLANAAAFVRKCADGLDRDDYDWCAGSGDGIEYRVVTARQELAGMLASFAEFLERGRAQGLDVYLVL